MSNSNFYWWKLRIGALYSDRACSYMFSPGCHCRGKLESYIKIHSKQGIQIEYLEGRLLKVSFFRILRRGTKEVKEDGKVVSKGKTLVHEKTQRHGRLCSRGEIVALYVLGETGKIGLDCEMFRAHCVFRGEMMRQYW